MFIRFDMIHESEKITVFMYRSPQFCFPWRHPCGYHAKRKSDAICCMDGKTIQSLPNPSQHVPIYLQWFPSYTMLKSMRKSKNRHFLPHFGFPWRRPRGNHAKCCMDGKRIRCLQIVSQMGSHLSSTVSQLFKPQVQKIAVFTYRSTHFSFPWRRPCDYHAICCMDGKTIQCLQNPSQHVPIYL